MSSETPKAKRNKQNKSTSISIAGDTTGNIIVGDSNVIGYTSEKVAELLKQINKTFQPKSFDGRCPYKGLDVFDEEDADLFFGREKLVKELVGRVNESRTVFITGPSGSGKSSLVRAGLIHALKQGAIKNSDKWLYESIKPGRNPFEALAFAFSRLKSPELGKYFSQNIHQPNVLDECAESALSEKKDQRLVLFIDQFEEIFTQVSKDITEAFIQLITNAVTKQNGRVIILFCMRSDFIPNCATYPELNTLLNQQFIQIGAMQAEELVSAIAQPALRVGLKIDPDLIAQIINDMKGEPGALPLMQFTLKDLFDDGQSKGGVIALTLDAYLGHGGIQKSLERHADAAFGKLEKHEQELARSIFSGLIEIGRGTQDTRRTALFEELIPANTNESEVETIVQKLADARLVTTDEQAGKDTITISHEKLIDAWPWLKKLVNENREVIALQNEINTDAKEWGEHKRDASYLYTGARLLNADEQVKKQNLNLNQLAKEFVKTSRTRKRRSQGLLYSGISVVLIVSIIASVIFRNQTHENIEIAQTAQAANDESQRQTRIARANELAAQSVIFSETNHQLSLLLALESFYSYDTVQSRSALMESLRANPQTQSNLEELIGHKLKSSAKYPISIEFSPDGKFLVSGYHNGTVIFWNVTTKQSDAQITFDSTFISGINFVQNGNILVIHNDIGTITLWDINAQKSINPLVNYEMLDISSDGNILALRDKNQGGIILWNLITAETIGQRLINSHYANFSPDGNYLFFSSENDSFALDIKNGTHIKLPFDKFLAFSSDGSVFAGENSVDQNIILWDIKSQQLIGKSFSGYTYWTSSSSFSPDNKTLASAVDYGTINLWDVGTSQLIGQPLRASFTVQNIMFSPDGQYLAAGIRDGTIILWDLKTRQPIGQPLNSTISTFSYQGLTFSPDGKILASTDTSDDSVILWDIDPDSWIQKACARAGRNLTMDEWIRYFPNEDYRIICPQWPPKPEFIITPQPAG